MRSGRPSLLDSARFLWVISPKVWESGVRGRIGTIRFALSRWGPNHDVPTGPILLIDHNSGKVPHAERVFGSPVSLANPLVMRHRWRWRTLLLLACLLPVRARGVASALVHATNLRDHLHLGQKVVLWNPYTLLQFAVDERVGSEASYHLSASYPALRQVRRAHGCSLALDVLGYEQPKRVETLQPWAFERSDPVLVIYLSHLNEVPRHDGELSLLAAVRAWRERTLAPIEIFIHYINRGTAVNDPQYRWFFDEFGDLVSDRDSLAWSSSSQISLSALSTIGLDLLSMDIAHFVVAPEPSSSEPDEAWQARLDPLRPDVLRVGDGVDQWLRKIRSSHPDLFQQVFEVDA